MKIFENSFFVNLEQADNYIKSAFNAKSDFLKKNLKPVLHNVETFRDLWEAQQTNIKLKIKAIGTELNYQFPRIDYQEYSFDSFMRSVSNRFPVFNDGGDDILEDSPDINYQWEIESKSTDNMIIWQITPFNQRSRYPVDPENNPLIFDYVIDTDIHEQSLHLDDHQRTALLTVYFNNTVENQLTTIKEKIVQIQKSMVHELNKIDFTDPNIIKEIQRKLKT